MQEGQPPNTPHDGALTRRGLIGGAAALGAAAALPGAAGARTTAHHRPKKRVARPRARGTAAEVIVVGGGLSGLVAARNLLAAGHSVIVLEGRKRVGGRIWAYELGGGEIAERGATFVGPTQDKVINLAKDLGITTFPTYDNGNAVYLADGQRSTYSDTGPTGTAPVDPTILVDIATVVANLDSMASSVDPRQPWATASATAWDAQTLDSYIASQSISSRFRKLATVTCRAVFGCESRDISLLFTLFYIASSGDEQNPGTFERNFNTRAGAQQDRIVGGTQRIPETIARQLGSRVRLAQPVRRIRQNGRGVEVATDALTYRGKRVIVAASPALAGRIRYEPLMPYARDQLMQRVPQGNLVKVTAVYDKPFWRDDNLSGQAVSLDGMANITFDDSPPSGNRGVLLAFVGGDAARRYLAMSPAARREAVIGDFVNLFGDKAKAVKDFVETLWPVEEFTRGCPVGLGTPGTLSEYGPALREPVGRIHWAGTETSDYWNGYMDGAVRAGNRAATEVGAAL